MSNIDAHLAHHQLIVNYPSSQPAEDDGESMNFQSVKYARKIVAPANPLNSEPLLSPGPIRNEDPTYIALLRAGMNTDTDLYEKRITPTFPEVIKSYPDMPKPDMPDGNYSTKQGNLLIIYKQEQEGGVRDEE